MIRLLLNKFKEVLILLLVAFLLIGNGNISEGTSDTEYIRYSVGETRIEQRVDESISVWAMRKHDIVIRVGEYSGKQGKRVYINEGINWKNIPTDIPIHKDNDGYYIQEFDINKKIATRVYKELIERGVNAKLQIASGRKEDLNAAGRIANQSNPKLYLSFHTNAYNGTSNGYFAMYNEGNQMAKNIANRLSTSIKDNGMVRKCTNRANNGYIGEMNVLNNSTCGVLMEMGYFDNLEELVKITSDEYANYVAEHMADEIQNVLNDFWK